MRLPGVELRVERLSATATQTRHIRDRGATLLWGYRGVTIRINFLGGLTLPSFRVPAALRLTETPCYHV